MALVRADDGIFGGLWGDVIWFGDSTSSWDTHFTYGESPFYQAQLLTGAGYFEGDSTSSWGKGMLYGDSTSSRGSTLHDDQLSTGSQFSIRRALDSQPIHGHSTPTRDNKSSGSPCNDFVT